MMSKETECLYPMRKDSTPPKKEIMKEYLNLVDWKGLELPSTERRSECQEIQALPNCVGTVD